MRLWWKDTEWNYRQKPFGDFTCAKAKYDKANQLESHSSTHKYLLNIYLGSDTT